MIAYRKVLYANYHSTQSGRASELDTKNYFNGQIRHFRSELLPLLPAKKDIKILDIGCGFGSWVKVMHQAGYQNAEGIDLSEEQIETGINMGVKKISVGNAHEILALNPGKYHVISAIDLIEHLTKDELVDFLNLCKSALKPGGKVIFRCPNLDAFMASAFANGDFTHENFMNKSSAAQVMASVGYRNIRVSGGLIFNANPALEFIRKILWNLHVLHSKVKLFASGRTWHDVEFTPNLLIEGESGA